MHWLKYQYSAPNRFRQEDSNVILKHAYVKLLTHRSGQALGYGQTVTKLEVTNASVHCMDDLVEIFVTIVCFKCKPLFRLILCT